jgi:hypothetical protein
MVEDTVMGEVVLTCRRAARCTSAALTGSPASVMPGGNAESHGGAREPENQCNLAVQLAPRTPEHGVIGHGGICAGTRPAQAPSDPSERGKASSSAPTTDAGRARQATRALIQKM